MPRPSPTVISDVYHLKVPSDASSMLISHGDGLKSLLLLLVLGVLAQRGQSVLLVDYEWSADRHRARKVRLFGTDRLDGLFYLSCKAPLVVERDRIQRFCDDSALRLSASTASAWRAMAR